jgi:beta-lactamase class D
LFHRYIAWFLGWVDRRNEREEYFSNELKTIIREYNGDQIATLEQNYAK